MQITPRSLHERLASFPGSSAQGGYDCMLRTVWSAFA